VAAPNLNLQEEIHGAARADQGDYIYSEPSSVRHLLIFKNSTTCPISSCHFKSHRATTFEAQTKQNYSITEYTMTYTVTVLYPDGAKFNLDYYKNTHMPLVQKEFADYGFKGVSVTTLTYPLPLSSVPFWRFA
jgi:hypothetical protein